MTIHRRTIVLIILVVSLVGVVGVVYAADVFSNYGLGVAPACDFSGYTIVTGSEECTTTGINCTMGANDGSCIEGDTNVVEVKRTATITQSGVYYVSHYHRYGGGPWSIVITSSLGSAGQAGTISADWYWHTQGYYVGLDDRADFYATWIGTNRLDKLRLESQVDFASHDSGLICGGDVIPDGDYWWHLDGYGGPNYIDLDCGYSTAYPWDDGEYSEYLGAVVVGSGQTITQGFTVVDAGTYTLTYACRAGNNTVTGYIKQANGTIEITVPGGNCYADDWHDKAGSDYLATGSYYVEFATSGGSVKLDNIAVECPSGVDCSTDCSIPEDGDGWGAGATVFYPLTGADDLGYYQVFSETTEYGLPYSGYNIWETTADATVYAIIPLQITEVGQNFLGYYVEAVNTGWETPSTTLRYEGLASVETTVSPGLLVGSQCPIGTVANRWEFGPDTYHFLLGVMYPDEETPYDPRPWMWLRPNPNACIPSGEPPGPEPGPGSLWEPVCTDCVRPGLADLLNIGKWVDWLGCTITNLILCWLVRLINTVIAFIVGIWEIISYAIGWLASLFDLVLAWIGSWWNNARIWISNLYASVVRVVMESELIQLIWAGLRLGLEVFEQVKIMIATVFGWVLHIGDRFIQVFEIARDFVTSFADIFSVEPVDIFGWAGFSETGGGAAGEIPDDPSGSYASGLAASGPSNAKAITLLFYGLWWLDFWFGNVPTVGYLLIWVLYAVLGWRVIWWAKSKFERVAITS